MPSVYLITGAGRGLGLELVKALTVAPDTVVFAGARDPTKGELPALASAHPDKVIPIAIDSADVSGNQAAAKIIEEKAGKLDVVIANAGMGNSRAIRDVDEADLLQTIKVNVLGPLVLFQATDHLLRKADQMGKFVVITSAQGSIADMSPGRSGSYGISKAAVNALTVKLQEETPDLVVFGLDPGFIATEGAKQYLREMGAPPEVAASAPPVEDTVASILAHIGQAVKVDNPKTFWSAYGSREVAF